MLLLPQMLGARDLPFPRLSAYAFWAYLIGGLAFFASLFFGLAPSGGWFMYPPLSSLQFSPGINADFWLLGIGFIEISAIAGAIEIIVGVLRNRAPGMTLDKMPIFAWAMLIFACMIIIAFPSIILSTTLLEVERAFGWPFFDPLKGGDPLLWQHLFWFFGHPEVYIIFLPAAGAMSTIVPAVAKTPLVGYRLVVLAMLATGFISFGVWAHHMFTTGMPTISTSFFSSASMAVVIAGYAAAAGLAWASCRTLRLDRPRSGLFATLLMVAAAALITVSLGVDIRAWLDTGLRPEVNAQGATVYVLMGWQGFFAAIVAVMGLYIVLRGLAGHMQADRPTTADIIALFIVYSAAQGAFATLLTRLFPGG